MNRMAKNKIEQLNLGDFLKINGLIKKLIAQKSKLAIPWQFYLRVAILNNSRIPVSNLGGVTALCNISENGYPEK